MNPEIDGMECEGCGCRSRVSSGPVYYVIKEYHWDGHIRTLCERCGMIREIRHPVLLRYKNDVVIKLDTETGMPLKWWGHPPGLKHTYPTLRFWAKGWQRKMDKSLKMYGAYSFQWHKIMARLHKADYRTLSTPTVAADGDGTTHQAAKEKE